MIRTTSASSCVTSRSKDSSHNDHINKSLKKCKLSKVVVSLCSSQIQQRSMLCVVENFAKSLKITQGHSKLHCSVRHV